MIEYIELQELHAIIEEKGEVFLRALNLLIENADTEEQYRKIYRIIAGIDEKGLYNLLNISKRNISAKSSTEWGINKEYITVEDIEEVQQMLEF